MSLKKTLVATTLVISCWNAQALSEAPIAQQANPQAESFITPAGAHFILNGGLTYGGDTLATAVYTNGDTKNIKAGSIFQFGMGGLWQMQDTPIAIQLTANYHFDGASGSNGSLKFTRYPIEGLLYYTGIERVHLGAGVRYVLSPSYKDNVGISYTVNFENTTGLVGEFGYAMTPVLWMNFRLVSEKYKSGSTTVNGNHAGLIFTYRFE